MPRGGPIAPCGTRAAYQRHLRERKKDPSIKIDDACLKANAAAMKADREKVADGGKQHKFMTRTHQQALQVLKSENEDRFAVILYNIRLDAMMKEESETLVEDD